MYDNGEIVTLVSNKVLNGASDDPLTLTAGMCGMVVQQKKIATNGNHEYIVDFGPYGQCYCYHNELLGNKTDGWDQSEEIEPMTIIPFGDAHIPMPNTDESNPFEDTVPPVIDVEKDIARRAKEYETGFRNVHR